MTSCRGVIIRPRTVRFVLYDCKCRSLNNNGHSGSGFAWAYPLLIAALSMKAHIALSSYSDSVPGDSERRNGQPSLN